MAETLANPSTSRQGLSASVARITRIPCRAPAGYHAETPAGGPRVTRPPPNPPPPTATPVPLPDTSVRRRPEARRSRPRRPHHAHAARAPARVDAPRAPAPPPAKGSADRGRPFHPARESRRRRNRDPSRAAVTPRTTAIPHRYSNAATKRTGPRKR